MGRLLVVLLSLAVCGASALGTSKELLAPADGLGFNADYHPPEFYALEPNNGPWGCPLVAYGKYFSSENVYSCVIGERSSHAYFINETALLCSALDGEVGFPLPVKIGYRKAREDHDKYAAGVADFTYTKQESCQNQVRPCSGQGLCTANNECTCNTGYTGMFCNVKVCPSDCSGHGVCQGNTCLCKPGYYGADCATFECPNHCSDRGFCIEDGCYCKNGYGGSDCSIEMCPSNCNDHGVCTEDNKCQCDDGFSGEACESQTCPKDCSGNGNCIDGICYCKHGFMGDACDQRTCPNDCSNNGHCQDGICNCKREWLGKDCSIRKCPNHCSNHGECVDGVCHCNVGYLGQDCSLNKECPEDCNANGICLRGICFCYQQYAGTACNFNIGDTPRDMFSVVNGTLTLKTEDKDEFAKLAKHMERLGSVFTSRMEQMKQTQHKLSEMLAGQVNEFAGDVKGKMEAAEKREENISGSIDNARKEQKSGVDALNASLSKAAGGIRKQLAQSTDALLNSLGDGFKSTNDHISGVADVLNDDVTDINNHVTNATVNTNKHLTSVANDISSEIGGTNEHLNQVDKSLSSQMTAQDTSTKKQIAEATNAVMKMNSQNHLDESKQIANADAAERKMTADTSETTQKEVAAATENLSKLVSKNAKMIDNDVASSAAQTQRDVHETSAQVDKDVVQSSSNVQKDIQNTSQQVDKDVMESSAQIQQDIAEAHESTSDQILAAQARLQSQARRNHKKTMGSIGDLSEQMSNSTQRLSEQLANARGHLSDQITSDVSDAKNELSSEVAGVSHQLANATSHLTSMEQQDTKNLLAQDVGDTMELANANQRAKKEITEELSSSHAQTDHELSVMNSATRAQIAKQGLQLSKAISETDEDFNKQLDHHAHNEAIDFDDLKADVEQKVDNDAKAVADRVGTAEGVLANNIEAARRKNARIMNDDAAHIEKDMLTDTTLLAGQAHNNSIASIDQLKKTTKAINQQILKSANALSQQAQADTNILAKQNGGLKAEVGEVHSSLAHKIHATNDEIDARTDHAQMEIDNRMHREQAEIDGRLDRAEAHVLQTVNTASAMSSKRDQSLANEVKDEGTKIRDQAYENAKRITKNMHAEHSSTKGLIHTAIEGLSKQDHSEHNAIQDHVEKHLQKEHKVTRDLVRNTAKWLNDETRKSAVNIGKHIEHHTDIDTDASMKSLYDQAGVNTADIENKMREGEDQTDAQLKDGVDSLGNEVEGARVHVEGKMETMERGVDDHVSDTSLKTQKDVQNVGTMVVNEVRNAAHEQEAMQRDRDKGILTHHMTLSSAKKGQGCPKDCNGNGACFEGKCMCFGSYSGETCDTKTCPPPGCGEHGKCNDGVCLCQDGWKGPHCDMWKDASKEEDDDTAPPSTLRGKAGSVVINGLPVAGDPHATDMNPGAGGSVPNKQPSPQLDETMGDGDDGASLGLPAPGADPTLNAAGAAAPGEAPPGSGGDEEAEAGAGPAQQSDSAADGDADAAADGTENLMETPSRKFVRGGN